MNPQSFLIIDPYIEVGNVIYPSFQLPIQQGTVIGIYTDVTKIHTLMQWFEKQTTTYTLSRESALYERLTVNEYVQFSLKLFMAS